MKLQEIAVKFLKDVYYGTPAFTSSAKWEINSRNGKQKTCGWIETEANACKKNISRFCWEVIIFAGVFPPNNSYLFHPMNFNFYL